MIPCPFCGCEEPPVVVWQDHLNVDEVRMYCPECGAAGPPVELEKRADDEEARKAAEAALALCGRNDINR
jgi:hypothetical protein